MPWASHSKVLRTKETQEPGDKLSAPFDLASGLSQTGFPIPWDRVQIFYVAHDLIPATPLICV